ncbi:MAG: DUF2254 domain-containing protein [Algicola sp.]|nr:DUF2254 domain-containing protein [Algicola sp.]
MKNYLDITLKYIFKLKSKIAFYPTLLSLLGLLFALLMFYLESQGVSKYLLNHAPVFVVNDSETARSLLTTFIAGLISIMVFSFSLVMILLNQASTNFSPRVLPGLISNRRHQMVLGIYNSTLLYCIFTLVAIEPNGNKYQLPGFSVLLAIFFMTLCLGAFIYFIHSISQEIQVNNIMDRIFSTAKKRMEQLIDSESDKEFDAIDSSDWDEITSTTSGYFQDVRIHAIKDIISELDFKADILPVKGSYVLSGMPIIKTSIALDDEVKDRMLSHLHFSKGELIEENYVLAFKQITEIAVKAMSPGINDPGTAVNAIDYLTELFLLRMQKRDSSQICNSDDQPVLVINTVDFETLLFQVMAALRTYCKHDIVIVQKLFVMLQALQKSQGCNNDVYRKAVDNDIQNLYQDATAQLTNKADLKVVERLFQQCTNHQN